MDPLLLLVFFESIALIFFVGWFIEDVGFFPALHMLGRLFRWISRSVCRMTSGLLDFLFR